MHTLTLHFEVRSSQRFRATWRSDAGWKANYLKYMYRNWYNFGKLLTYRWSAMSESTFNYIYIKKYLKPQGPWCFPRPSHGERWGSRETKITVSRARLKLIALYLYYSKLLIFLWLEMTWTWIFSQEFLTPGDALSISICIKGTYFF